MYQTLSECFIAPAFIPLSPALLGGSSSSTDGLGKDLSLGDLIFPRQDHDLFKALDVDGLGNQIQKTKNEK